MFGETLDENTVEVAKSQERAYVLNFSWRWPVFDTRNFDGVHACHPPSKDYPQVIHFGRMEQTFVEGEKEIVLFRYLQDGGNGLDVVVEGGACGYADIVNVNADCGSLRLVFEDCVSVNEIHHGLES